MEKLQEGVDFVPIDSAKSFTEEQRRPIEIATMTLATLITAKVEKNDNFPEALKKAVLDRPSRKTASITDDEGTLELSVDLRIDKDIYEVIEEGSTSIQYYAVIPGPTAFVRVDRDTGIESVMTETGLQKLGERILRSGSPS